MIRYPTCGVLLALMLTFGPEQAVIAREAQLGAGSTVVLLAAGSENSKPGSEFKDCDTCPAMIVVPAGQFTMGSPPNEQGRADNEGPQHVVKIERSFAVGKYEVTFDEWEACVAERACKRPGDSGFGRGKRPVINVSYQDVTGYLTWLSAKLNKKYRLPSEAEWEYAARAGSDLSRFWGASPDEACQYANVFNANAKSKYKDAEVKAFKCSDGYVETAPVGKFKPNKFGLYDMLGNVWEWVGDCWNPNYTAAPADGSVWLTGDCSKRILRGGGWYYGPNNLRLAKRLNLVPTRGGHDVGFRVVRALP